MNQLEFFNLLAKDFELTEAMKQQFITYKNYLQEQNKVHNLTRLDSEDIIYEQYFYESIVPYKGFDFNHKSLLDIGSGSGIPGIALKILFPHMSLTILESNTKKINFMQSLAQTLGFDDITFFNQRAEEISSNQRETFDYVTSRAVAALKILVEISTPYLKVGGMLIEPKSLNYEQEHLEAQPIMKGMNVSLKEIIHYEEFKQHYIFLMIKDKITSKDFPRKWKDIIK